ncbi:MAG TPA: RHS repeat domain-containing protein [Paludibacter sp.]|nr:RHS repeat domain-containing protein [Paludibacter sp.]
MKRVIFSIILILLYVSSINSQNNLVSFPTPEASELGKYGQVPVSYFNGLPQISIPLYTVECKDISLPISLSYHAAGNKPDEHPTWVGLGWNLNCGGMITRIVNGIRDETDKDAFSREYGIGFTFNPGYYYRANEFDIQDWASTLLPKIVGNDYSYVYLDTQPDEFIFNFCGHSGSFWFVSENGQMTVKAKSKDGDILKVEPILFPGAIYYPVFEESSLYNKYNGYKFIVSKTFKTFKVTMRDGFIYEFGGDAGNIDFTTSNGMTSATSWHLTKITSPNGNYISLSYKKGGNVFVQRKSNYFYAVVSPQDNTNACNLSNNASIDGLSLAIVHPKYLSKMTTSVGQEINFFTSKTQELDYDNWTDIYSRYSNVCRGLFPNNATFDFDWSTDLPLVSYYLKLNRINIKGVKNINLFYTSSNTERLKLLGISTTEEDAFPGSLSEAGNQKKYAFSYNQTPLPIYNSRKTDNWGYYNNKDYSAISYSSYSTLYGFRVPELTCCKAEILESISYPTGGSTAFDYELNRYSKIISGLEFNEQPFTMSNDSGFAGGLRIKAITNYYDPDDSTKKTTKNYIYKNLDGSSSGILSGKPIYSLQGKKHIEYHESDWSGVCHWSANANFDLNYYIYSQNQLLPLSTTDGNHVTYSRVIEQESDGRKTIYNYTNHGQFPDEVPFLLSTNMDEVLINYFTSRELERGLLADVQVFNSANKLTKETKFTYNDDLDRYKNYVKTINRYVQPGGTCFNSIHINDFFRFSANKIYTFYPYLKEKEETIYDVDGNNPVSLTTDYVYNSYNLLKTEETTSSSPNVSTIKTVKKYSCDLSSPIYASMNGRFMLSYPVEITAYSGDKIIHSNLTTYKSVIDNSNKTLYLPEKTYLLETTASLSSFTPFDGISMDNHYSKSPEIEFLNYGSFGNINEIKERSGINSTYLWSYNNQYPIAEIKNATYSDVKSALGYTDTQMQGLSSNSSPDVSGIRNKLDSYFANKTALVTTYNYKPLVGMTSKTTPNGIMTRYVYDPFGRLMLARDNNGELTGRFQYSYRSSPYNETGNAYSPLSATFASAATFYVQNVAGSIAVNPAGGSGDFIYSWYLKGVDGSVLARNENTTSSSFSFVCQQVGAVTLECKVTDNVTGQFATTSQTATCYSLPTATMSTGSVYWLAGKNTGTATVSATGGSGNFTYNWYLKNSAGSILSKSLNTTSSQFDFSFSASGSFTLECTATDNVTGRSVTVTKNVTCYAPLVISSIAVQTNGYTDWSSALITATVIGGSGNFTYNWYRIVNGTIDISQLNSTQNTFGIYWTRGTDVIMCGVTDNVTGQTASSVNSYAIQ